MAKIKIYIAHSAEILQSDHDFMHTIAILKRLIVKLNIESKNQSLIVVHCRNPISLLLTWHGAKNTATNWLSNLSSYNFFCSSCDIKNATHTQYLGTPCN